MIYVVLGGNFDGKLSAIDKESLETAMQKSVKTKLNPLFGISDIVVTDSLPTTASNKVMRRVLRDEYIAAAA